MKTGAVWCLFLLVFGSAAASAQDAAVEFAGPPTLGDRMVSWTWEAVASDPVFTGNSTLKRVGLIGEPPLHDAPIADVVLGFNGDFGYSITEDGQQVAQWELETDSLVAMFAPIPDMPPVTRAAVDENSQALAAGLGDGRVAVWSLDRPDTLWMFQAHPTACTDLGFLPGALALRLITAGADGRLLQWDIDLSPNEAPDDPLELFAFPEAEARAFDFTSDNRFLVAGASTGEIRRFDLAEQFVTSIDNTLQNPITQIDVGISRGEIVAVEDLGGPHRFTIFDYGDNEIIAQFTSPAARGGARLALTPPDDLLLILSYDDGTLQIRNTATGRVFREGREELPTTAFAPHPDGSRAILGRTDGELVLWRAGFCQPSPGDPVCFGGYRVWRGLAPQRHPDEDEGTPGMVLVRQYNYGDSSWTFSDRDTLRYFIDPDSVSRRGMGVDEPVTGIHNGVPYYYAITQYNMVFDSGIVKEVYACPPENDSCVVRGIYRDPETGEPLAVVPRREPRTTAPVLEDVWVIPNPYNAEDPPFWN
ncbi:MAG: hypothetical protein GF355_13265, partial [Candidatus Eisenbacteria bacterium]|nr:hypothetical protein [Candidatus Eisenbacteria bacterium]